MDKTVPTGAAILLDFVREIEVGNGARSGYDVIYGHNQDKLKKSVTAMTVDQVQAAQRGWSRRFGSSATGGYQFMRATLRDLKAQLHLSGDELLDPDLQDRLALHLLRRRGYDQYMAGQIDRTEFGKRLAMEWASLPVLAPTKGAKRTLKRGQSYYAGDGLNKALVAPSRVEGLLDDALVAAAPMPEIEHVRVPVEMPGLDKPLGKSRTAWSAIGGLAATIIASMSALHWAASIALIVVAAGFAAWILYDRRQKARAQRAIVTGNAK